MAGKRRSPISYTLRDPFSWIKYVRKTTEGAVRRKYVDRQIPHHTEVVWYRRSQAEGRARRSSESPTDDPNIRAVFVGRNREFKSQRTALRVAGKIIVETAIKGVDAPKKLSSTDCAKLRKTTRQWLNLVGDGDKSFQKAKSRYGANVDGFPPDVSRKLRALQSQILQKEKEMAQIGGEEMKNGIIKLVQEMSRIMWEMNED